MKSNACAFGPIAAAVFALAGCANSESGTDRAANAGDTLQEAATTPFSGLDLVQERISLMPSRASARPPAAKHPRSR